MILLTRIWNWLKDREARRAAAEEQLRQAELALANCKVNFLASLLRPKK